MSDVFGAQRRRVIRIGIAAGTACALRSLAHAASGPRSGDLLVGDDVEHDPVALKPGDVPTTKPLLAFPFDAATKQIRNDSRLNKVLLLKVAEADLDADSKSRAAGGVLGFSAICTHQACEIKTWVAKDKVLLCYCHSSKFLPLQAGHVADGPAPRSLPMLPLALKDGRLVVAGEFSAPPGSTGQR